MTQFQLPSGKNLMQLYASRLECVECGGALIFRCFRGKLIDRVRAVKFREGVENRMFLFETLVFVVVPRERLLARGPRQLVDLRAARRAPRVRLQLCGGNHEALAGLIAAKRLHPRRLLRPRIDPR